MMYVDLNTAIENIASDVEFLQPLFEAIVNSLHAHATKINIDIEHDSNYITAYQVIDNGDGYTPLNIKSFSILWSKLKNEPGALGSGRLMYLRVFQKVKIESYTGMNKVSILFDRDFDPNNIVSTKLNQTKLTTTSFLNLKDEYNNSEPFNLQEIKEKIFNELLPMFSTLKDNQTDITISINNEIWVNKENLNSKFEQMNLTDISFEITPTEYSFLPEKFHLYYNISDDKKNEITQFYGAASRKVKNFSSKVSIRKLPNNASGIFCLTSTYLDNRVVDNRRDFRIKPGDSNISPTNPISFVQINNALQEKLNEIILTEFPTYKEDFKQTKETLIDKYPHLYEFINSVENVTFTNKEIIDEAEKKMQSAYKDTRKKLDDFNEKIKSNKKFDEDAFKKITKTFTKTGRDQLASYIAYRQTILDMMRNVIEQTKVDPKSFNEKSIHELFMPQYTTSEDYPRVGTNMWLLDDKFMSYMYAASESQIISLRQRFSKELQEMGEDVNDTDRLDIVLFFSDNNENLKKDIVIIELKKVGATYHEKIKAVTQLQIYASVIADTIENIRSIYSYTVIDIDEKYRKYLTRTARFKENSFGENQKISSYYSYNPDINAHLHVISFEQVILDAQNRNGVFLDILKEVSKD